MLPKNGQKPVPSATLPAPRPYSNAPSARMGRFGKRVLQRVTSTCSNTTMIAFADMMKPYCDSSTPKCSLPYAGSSIMSSGDGIVAAIMMTQNAMKRRSRNTGPYPPATTDGWPSTPRAIVSRTKRTTSRAKIRFAPAARK